MAIYDAIARAIDDPNQNVQISVKPLTAVPSATGASSAGSTAGGSSASSAAGTSDAGTANPAVTTQITAAQRLTKNPQLATTPGGSYTDPQYEADLAAARQSFSNQYLDVLQKLGFVDDSGNFIPGTVETAAARQQADLQNQKGLAIRGVTEGAQRGGTVFSGRRATLQSDAQHPFDAALAQLQSDTPLQLGGLFQGASGLINTFQTQMQQLLAQAAGRRADELRSKALQDALASGAAAGSGSGTTPKVAQYNSGGFMPGESPQYVPSEAGSWAGFVDPNTGVPAGMDLNNLDDGSGIPLWRRIQMGLG